MSSLMLFIGTHRGIVGIEVSCEETHGEDMVFISSKGRIVPTFRGIHQTTEGMESEWQSGSCGFRIQRMWKVHQKWTIDPHLRELSIDWKVLIMAESGSSCKVHDNEEDCLVFVSLLGCSCVSLMASRSGCSTRICDSQLVNIWHSWWDENSLFVGL
jgi:hypothetical protein